MKRYLFTMNVTSAHGWQLYYADAESEAAALAIVDRGDGVFVDEEVEVMDLGEPELCGVEEIPA